ncbi:hypothetical protein [Sphaerisporangium rubeum]|uniref:YcaO domain-containing protein n=1 Tax=Sphaerisporangium rubeum TaxID=321317 RepID=A0A7X0M5H1_9ACTN|nr:hypothetical protein [Sphaerisporangium rubeum]MBB6472668.1 hypothetical protein [Sphaerisporangium rubeum]
MTDLLGGLLHIAYAERPEVVTVATGFTPDSARDRAELRASALASLRALTVPVPEKEPAGSYPANAAASSQLPIRVLGLADFMPDPPDDGPERVSGIGVLTGERYLVPAEVVWTDEAGARVEPTLVGLVADRREGVSGAIADLLAHDVVTRWWADPRTPLHNMSRRVPGMLPSGVADALTMMRLRVSAFVLPASDFPIAVVGVSGDGTTIAAAASRSVTAAVREAFLRAMAARAQPWDTLPTADSLRRLTVWHRETDYLTHLERWATASVPPPSEPSDPLGWADIACRRFGHEPILIGRTPATAAKVICPGAACHHRAPAGTPLPCPVP